jgi:predicted NAD-dependent protein-ADP-ribosyltransferase YbiA (DUF1768 family)
MVYSNIHSSVFYKETSALDPNDMNHESDLYEINIYDTWITIILGKLNTKFADKDIVYYPIYLVHNKKIISQIGVYELKSEKSIEYIDKDGAVDIEALDEPLLYGFVDETLVQKYNAEQPSQDFTEKRSPEKETKKDEVEQKKETYPENDDSSDEDEIDKVKVPSWKKTTEVKKALQTLKEGVFEVDEKVKPPQNLIEETEQEAIAIKKEFKISAHIPWIAKFMKNNHYEIHEVEVNGDCFFAVIRDAFKQIGQITTVDKLRALLAKEATEANFHEQHTLYLSLDGKVKEYSQELKRIKHTLEVVMKQRAIKSKEDSAEMAKIFKETAELQKQYKDFQEEKRNTETLIDENVGKYNNINTLDKFREYVQTPKFWADSWAIATLERLLNIKMIIMSQRSFQEGSLDSVINCGEVDPELQKKSIFNPKYYIIATFSGDHFKLITYKNKRIFNFSEIPFFVKNLIVNKCIEKNAGPFYIIPEFKNLKTKLGIEDDAEVEGQEEKEDDPDLYSKDIDFMFWDKAPKSMKPGEGSNEKIPTTKKGDFAKLYRIPEWRRKLDDSWQDIVFKIDGHKWASVEHYYQAAKYKNGFPDFFLQFSLDSNSEIAKNVDMARAAGGKTGKLKGLSLRPKSVVIDPDFYGMHSKETRETALRAKFTQNADLKQMLVLTKPAKLLHFERGSPAKPDYLLMKIRNELA